MKKLILMTFTVMTLATSAYAETIEVTCEEYAEKTGRAMPCDSPKWAMVRVDSTDYIIQQNKKREQDGLELLPVPRPAWLDSENLSGDEKPEQTSTTVPPWLQ